MTPFDSAAYAALTKGLDVREITFSHVLMADAMRMEAEFYTTTASAFESTTGAGAIRFSQYGTSKELNERSNGVPVLRLNEFDLSFIGCPAKWSTLSIDEFNALKLKSGDVLICRTNGNPHLVGKSALVCEDADIAFASYLFRVRPKESVINAATLVAFLNSRYGRVEIERYAMRGNQANFSPAKFRLIKIPLLGNKLNRAVAKIMHEAYSQNIKARKCYEAAEVELERVLSIDAWRPTEGNISVKTFADAMNAGRIDAEYFQLRHDEILARLKSLGKFEYASEILVAGLEKVVPESIERYIELADVGAQGTIEECTDAEWRDLPSRARQRIRSGQIIVSSIEGSLESCALVEGEFDNALCSTGFHRFHSEQTNSETLLLIFKSWPLQSLLKRGCSGTILTGISSSELERIPVPILPRKVQDSLAKKVRKAFALRKESKKLIAEARQMVEDAIDGKVA